jgi:hypothetical protein
MINEWLDKCNSARRLDYNFKSSIKYALDNVIKNGYLPMKLDTLSLKKKSLFDILKPTDNKKI